MLHRVQGQNLIDKNFEMIHYIQYDLERKVPR